MHRRLHPAESAGVKTGDVIVEFDGKEVEDSADLPLIVARTKVGKRVSVALIRTSDGWRGIKVTTFERRQCETIREELDSAHNNRHGVPRAKSRGKGGVRPPSRTSSSSRA